MLYKLNLHKKAIFSALGEVSVGDSFDLILTGRLNDETPIGGQDCIYIVERNK